VGDNSSGRTFSKQLLTYLPSRLLPALTSFILTPLVTRLFEPAEFGYWALAVGASDLLYAFACSGIGAGVVRFFEAFRVKAQVHAFLTSLAVSLGLAILPTCGISLLVLAFFKGEILPALYPLLQIGILIFAFQSVFNILSNMMVAQERSAAFTAFQLLNRYGGIAVGLSFVLAFGLRVEGLLWGTLLVLALCIPFMVRASLKGLDFRAQPGKAVHLHTLWSYGFPLAVGNTAMWGLRLSDRYLIGLFRPEHEVGLYSAAYNLSGKSIEIVAAMFGLSTFPILVKIWENEGRQATEKALAQFTRLYLILGIPVSAGISLFSSPFLSLFAAEGYHEGYRVVGPVAFSAFTWQLALIAGYGLLVRQKTRAIAANQILAALVNLGLNLVLIPRYGFVIGGITTLTGYLVLFILQGYSSRRYLTWHFPFNSLRNVLIATLLMGVMANWFYGLSGSPLELRPGYLLLSILLGMLVYFGALGLLGEMNEVEKEITARFFRRLRARMT
jgi:O-antigen/teichoic acid export membrane protein